MAIFRPVNIPKKTVRELNKVNKIHILNAPNERAIKSLSISFTSQCTFQEPILANSILFQFFIQQNVLALIEHFVSISNDLLSYRNT